MYGFYGNLFQFKYILLSWILEGVKQAFLIRAHSNSLDKSIEVKYRPTIK